MSGSSYIGRILRYRTGQTFRIVSLAKCHVTHTPMVILASADKPGVVGNWVRPLTDLSSKTSAVVSWVTYDDGPPLSVGAIKVPQQCRHWFSSPGDARTQAVCGMRGTVCSLCA